MRALVLEDDPDMAERVVAALERELGAQTRVVPRGEDALRLASRPGFDVLVLDRLVVGMDGLDVLTQLRRAGVQTPALVLSSKNRPADKVEGLDEGADDYLGKPFEDFELVARVRALVRRAERLEHPDVRGHGPLVLSTRSRRALWRPGVPDGAERFRKRSSSDARLDLQLTGKEFDIVLCLADAYPDPRSKDDIWRFVWNTVQLADWQQVVHVNLSRLRTKLDERTGRRRVLALAAAVAEATGEPERARLEALLDAVGSGELEAAPDDRPSLPPGRRTKGTHAFRLRIGGNERRIEADEALVRDRERRRELDLLVPRILSTVASTGYTIAGAEDLERLAAVAGLFTAGEKA